MDPKLPLKTKRNSVDRKAGGSTQTNNNASTSAQPRRGGAPVADTTDDLARKVQESLRLDQREISRQAPDVGSSRNAALAIDSSSSSAQNAAIAAARKAAGFQQPDDLAPRRERKENQLAELRAMEAAAKQREEILRSLYPHPPKPPPQVAPMDFPNLQGAPLPHLPLQDPMRFQRRDQSSYSRWGQPYEQTWTVKPFVSPLPNIEYPRLMNTHQQQQGYIPTKNASTQLSHA